MRVLLRQASDSADGVSHPFQVIFNLLGLLLYNTFPEKVVLKGSPLLAPFVCIRVVTRGDYPELVRANALRNMNTCLSVGMENFMIEVATDKPVHLAKHARMREVVVPTSYATKSGALFKARALQYCLEEEVNMLQATDWVLHLDEETLLTENAVRGVLNFVLDGKHQFGQGLITYANENVVNWVTTLADSFRVADDMGKLRFQFKRFHRPLFSWKGSYVVTQVRLLGGVLAAPNALDFNMSRTKSYIHTCSVPKLVLRLDAECKIHVGKYSRQVEKANCRSPPSTRGFGMPHV